LFLPIVLSSIPVDKTTIADMHYLHKNFQYTILVITGADKRPQGARR